MQLFIYLFIYLVWFVSSFVCSYGHSCLGRSWAELLIVKSQNPRAIQRFGPLLSDEEPDQQSPVFAE
jgi:hypothetical protein